jgi:hypothetical protein
MKIKLLLPLVNKEEGVQQRRLAIQKSWSIPEIEERRRVAIESQSRLASLIALGRPGFNRFIQEMKFTACFIFVTALTCL